MKKIVPIVMVVALAAGAILYSLGCDDKIPPMAAPKGPIVAAGGDTSLSVDVDPPQQCEPDCGGGDSGDVYPDPTPGTGLSGWKYVWRDPDAMGTINQVMQAFAAQQFYFYQTDWSFEQNDTRRRLIPSLMDKDNQADELALAKAIIYRKDSDAAHSRMPAGAYGYSYCFGGSAPCNPPAELRGMNYYDEVWHAIQFMMVDTYRAWSGGSCSNNGAIHDWDDLCADGQLGVARNLVGWLAAADYLMSMGPVSKWGFKDDDGAGPSGCSNSATYDSLKTFVADVVRRSNGNVAYLKAPDNCDCTRDTQLYTVMRSPDNKGAAALTSYVALASLGLNMQSNPLLYKYGGTSLCSSPYNHTQWCAWPQTRTDGNSVSYSTEYAAAKAFYKGWQADATSTGHDFYADGKLDTYKGGGTWAKSFVQGDSVYALSTIPAHGPWPLKPGRTVYSRHGVHWTLTDTTTCNSTKAHWEGNDKVRGLPVAEMDRWASDNGNLGVESAASSAGGTCKMPIDGNAKAHIEGLITYLANAAWLIYQQDVIVQQGSGQWIVSDPNSTYLVPAAANWWEYWAGQYNNSNTWPHLNDSGSNDNWPCTYIYAKLQSILGGSIAPSTGTASGRGTNLDKEGKQMSFTDVTHQ